MRLGMESVPDGHSVKQTAARIGYTFANHLSLAFKKHFNHRATASLVAPPPPWVFALKILIILIELLLLRDTYAGCGNCSLSAGMWWRVLVDVSASRAEPPVIRWSQVIKVRGTAGTRQRIAIGTYALWMAAHIKYFDSTAPLRFLIG